MTAEQGTFCTRCGASVAPGAYFCPRCGTSIPIVPGDAGATVATGSGGPPDAERHALLDALRQATLGAYEVLAEVGHGGVATGYLAPDPPPDRKGGIKGLEPALLLMGEGMAERFKREARTAAALSHPHIIPIYAVKEGEHVLYFVMKYVQGRPLDSVIRDVGPLPIPMVQAIVAQVGDALGYAHRHGVIHRDIKSANIMLDEEGWAVVTDFGIAKVLQAEGLTMTGVTVGTPTYMSPEQIGTHEVTGASDQYSLGVVAYEMLTGKLPFRGESIMSVMYAHFNQPARPVTELRPDCPPNLAAAVMRMLEKDPARRCGWGPWRPHPPAAVVGPGGGGDRGGAVVGGALAGVPDARRQGARSGTGHHRCVFPRPSGCGGDGRRAYGTRVNPDRRASEAAARPAPPARGARVGACPARGQLAAVAPRDGARCHAPRARRGRHACRVGERRHGVQGSGVARSPGARLRRDDAAHHGGVAVGGCRAPVAVACSARYAAPAPRGAGGGGASPSPGPSPSSPRSAAPDRAGDRRLRAGGGIARPEGRTTRLSSSHDGPAAGVEGPVPVGAEP